MLLLETRRFKLWFEWILKEELKMKTGYIIQDSSGDRTLTPEFRWARIGEADSWYVFVNEELERARKALDGQANVCKIKAQYNYEGGVRLIGYPESL